jgi:hypothetical protein
MFGRGICEKYQSRDEQFPEPNDERNLVSRLVFFVNTPPKHDILYRYIMFGRGICEKYQSRDEQFPDPNDERNLVSRLVFFANTPPKHDISV